MCDSRMNCLPEIGEGHMTKDRLLADPKALFGANDEIQHLGSAKELPTKKDPLMDYLLLDGHGSVLDDEFAKEKPCIDMADILPAVDTLGGLQSHMNVFDDVDVEAYDIEDGNIVDTIQRDDMDDTESIDSGEPYEIEDWEIDEILAESDQKEEASQIGLFGHPYKGDDNMNGLEVNETFAIGVCCQEVEQEIPKDIDMDESYDSDDSGEPYTMEDWEFDEILAQSEDKVLHEVTPITSDNDEDSGEEYDIEDWEIDEIIAHHDREQAMLAEIADNEVKPVKDYDDASTQKPRKSRLQNAKARMVKLLRGVLKPFNVFRRCVKQPSNDS